jgi:hypothetical protein
MFLEKVADNVGYYPKLPSRVDRHFEFVFAAWTMHFQIMIEERLGFFGLQHTDGIHSLPSLIRTYDVAYAQFYQDPLGSLKMAHLQRQNM